MALAFYQAIRTEGRVAVLFTLGYEKRSLEEFVSLLRSEKIGVLVDMRDVPWSHKPGFSKGPLAAAMTAAGIDYVHAAFAGNPKNLRATARSNADALARYRRHLDANPHIVAELKRLIAHLHGERKRVCLTCFERDPGACHRSILAERWARKGDRVTHIDPGAPPESRT